MNKQTNSKRTVITVLIIFVSLVLLIWLFNHTKREPSKSEPVFAKRAEPSIMHSNEKMASQLSNSTPANEIKETDVFAERIKRESDQEIAMWQGPILFYGKVINENNQPISGVQVSYNASAMNEFRKEIQNTGTVFTDERGIFKIDGVNGVGAMLELSHSNYYCYPNNINSFDKRGVPKGESLPNTEYSARLFRMHSKGNPVPLVHRVDGVNVPLDGIPKSLDLRGSDYNQKIGRLMVEATGTPPLRYDHQPFDWSVKVSVPNGGLVERTNQFEFIAPNSGYQPSIEFDFQKETSGWTDTISKDYFVKMSSGYARLNIYIGAKRPLFFSIEYDYNPDGSPNLERAR